MKIDLNGEYREFSLKDIDEKLLNHIVSNKDTLFGEAFHYCYGSDDLMFDAFYSRNDYEDITVIPYAVYVDNLLAGIVFLEDVSSDEEDSFFDVNIACATVKEFRGIGLIGKAIDIACMCTSVDTAYYVVHKDNISSLKAAKGYSICSNQEIHFGQHDTKDYVKLVKHYSKF